MIAATQNLTGRNRRVRGEKKRRGGGGNRKKKKKCAGREGLGRVQGVKRARR